MAISTKDEYVHVYVYVNMNAKSYTSFLLPLIKLLIMPRQ